jgi:NADPH:quinone reductase-like Zn-dependent oxidoreductase
VKAWRIAAHGGLDALKLEDIPAPEPGPMQARVRVEAFSLNHLDIWVRKGVEGHKFPLPITPGCDVAGVIDRFGPGAEAALQGLGAGAPVIVSPGISCGRCEACLGGFDPLCPHYGILGETMDGGAAEFVVVPVANVIARPAGLGAVEGAAFALPCLTAWTMLTTKTALRPGETVLIQAGGSGVSVAAIQIAKLLGAEVITTVGSDEKVARARALGADHVINYRATKFRDELKRILAPRGKRGVEVVVDHVGEETFADSLKSLAWGGRFVTCGATSGAKVEVDLKALFFKNLSILGSTMGSKADLIRITQLVAAGKLKPVVDSTFPFDRYAEAQARLESRQAFGKVVVTR